MYYALKSDCYFKKYDEIGYIARPIISIEEVVDKIGAIFLEQLSYNPRHIDDIVNGILDGFEGVNREQLKLDAVDFYSSFIEDGFVNFADSLETFDEKGFEYSTLEGKIGYSNLKPQLEESSSHLLNLHFKNKPHLLTFHVELTSCCNERCIHCYIPHENKTREIEYDLMMDVLNQCKDLNVMTIVFSGGEPMLHPNFCEFLKAAKDKDFNITVLSNLTLLTDEIIDALMYRHACCVNVSLYSMDEKVHDEITTVKGSFRKTKNNILRLIDNNVPVQINLPVMKQNKDSFFEVIQWGQNHKCTVNTDYLMMARLDHSTDNLIHRLSPEDMDSVIRNFMKNDVVARYNMDKYDPDDYKNIEIDLDDRVCGVGITTLCMVTNGDVFPCAGWQKYTCGNLKENTLKNIWEDSPQVNYLRKLRKKDFKKCLGCENREFCLMCMSRNSNENANGDLFDIPQITCEAAKIHHGIVEEIKNNGGI